MELLQLGDGMAGSSCAQRGSPIPPTAKCCAECGVAVVAPPVPPAPETTWLDGLEGACTGLECRLLRASTRWTLRRRESTTRTLRQGQLLTEHPSTIPGTCSSPQVTQHAVPGGGSTPSAGGTATGPGVTGPARSASGTPGLVRIPPAMPRFYPCRPTSRTAPLSSQPHPPPPTDCRRRRDRGRRRVRPRARDTVRIAEPRLRCRA